MKTYKEIIEQPKLVISYDYDSDTPRNWSNLSILIIRDNKGDDNSYLTSELERTQYEVNNAEEHKQLMIEVIEDHFGSKVVYSDFISKYEHSGVSYFIGQSSGWDYSNIGFVFVTEGSLKEIGCAEEDIEEIVKCEIETFSQWANGEIYHFTLYDDEGNEEDSLGGIYGLEEIKEYLPEEWQEEDLSEYINYN